MVSQDLLWSRGLHRSLDWGERKRGNGCLAGETRGEERKEETMQQRQGSWRERGQWKTLGCPRLTLLLLPMLT